MASTLFQDLHGGAAPNATGAEDTSSTNAAAISLKTVVTNLVTAGAETRTLAAGYPGQIKILRMKTDGGDCVVTVTGNPTASDQITFNDALDFVVMVYCDSAWIVLVNSGATVA